MALSSVFVGYKYRINLKTEHTDEASDYKKTDKLQVIKFESDQNLNCLLDTDARSRIS